MKTYLGPLSVDRTLEGDMRKLYGRSTLVFYIHAASRVGERSYIYYDDEDGNCCMIPNDTFNLRKQLRFIVRRDGSDRLAQRRDLGAYATSAFRLLQNGNLQKYYAS